MQIGERIKYARERAGPRGGKMIQATLAKHVDVVQTAVSSWEQGINSPKRREIAKLAKALKVTEEWLEFGSEADYPGRAPSAKSTSSALASPTQENHALLEAVVKLALEALPNIQKNPDAGARVIVATYEKALFDGLDREQLEKLRFGLELLGDQSLLQPPPPSSQ